MTSDNFNQFCKLLSDNFILHTYSAYGVMVDFKRLLKDIKSEIYTELQSGNSDKNLFLGKLINEIDKTDYPKDESKITVQKWLDKYEITIESIFNEDFLNTTFFKVFEVDTYLQDHPIHYSDEHSEPYYRDANALQHDFLFYFRWHFAKELLQFIHPLKDKIEPQKPTKQKTAGFETKYLDKFCFEIQDINSLHRNSFLQCYDNGILPYTDFLKQEVYENLTTLSEKKAPHYLNFVHSKISNTKFYNTPQDYLHFDILAFDTQDIPFPYRENKDLKFYISTCYNAPNVDYDHRERMYDLQHKFFSYASMIEAKKNTSFVSDLLQEKPSEIIIPDDMKKNTSSSITSAQIVKDLIKNITSLRDFYQGLESSYITFDQEIDSINYEIERERGETKYIEKIKNGLNELYLQSNKDNYYFFDCTLKAYLSNIDKKIKDYLELHVDANMIDFYKTEINYLLNPEDNRLLYSHNKKDVVNYNYFCNDFSNFEISLNKKIEHITNELIGLGVETTIEENYIGRDGDQLVKTPIFKKINRPYAREKADVIIPTTQTLEKIENKTKMPSSKKIVYNTYVFRSKEAQEWFYNALDELNAFSNGKIKVRGFQAKANSIYCNEDCKTKIFKYELSLKDYIGFLVENFKVKITDKTKLSNGIKHSNEVKRLINQFVKSAEE